MMKKANLSSSLTSPGSGVPSPSRPPIQDSGLEPGSAYLPSHASAGPFKPEPPSSSEGPATFCHCHTVIATSPGYVDEDGEEHDPEYYYRHCERHYPGKTNPWAISSLGDLMKLTGTTLTKEGRAYWKELRRKSDEQNPYIAEMERVKAEIQKVDDELNFMGVAKEKIKDWNQESQGALARTGKGIPFPAWLERYRDLEKFYETKKQLEQKRQMLMDRKFDLHIEIVNWRYQISNPEGGTL